jgi:hypothetical protein
MAACQSLQLLRVSGAVTCTGSAAGAEGWTPTASALFHQIASDRRNRGKFQGAQLQHENWCAAEAESFESVSTPGEHVSTAVLAIRPGICPAYQIGALTL